MLIILMKTTANMMR